MKKTDNSFLFDKIVMRLNHLPGSGDVSVLDAFSGKGVIWREVQKRTKRNIDVTSIDCRDDKDDFHLHGDNTEWMASIDLDMFDVIDLDAYGIPYDQMMVAFDSGWSGTMFITFIQTGMGMIPKGMVEDIGFSAEAYEESPILFSKIGQQVLRRWLYARGVRRWYIRRHGRKIYAAFNCAVDAS